VVLFIPGSGGHPGSARDRRDVHGGAGLPALLPAHDGGGAAAYGAGTYSSGKITARLVERAASRLLAASKQPDSRTVNESGSGTVAALTACSPRCLRLCQRAGLVKPCHKLMGCTRPAYHEREHRVDRSESGRGEPGGRWRRPAPSGFPQARAH
jgi:hypothetical protein